MVTKSSSQSAERKKTSASNSTAITPAKNGSSNGSGPSTQEAMRRLYTSLLRCRILQEQASRRKNAKYEIAIGDEAVVAGTTAELTPEDTIAATSTNLAALVVRGIPIDALLRKSENCASAHSITHSSLPADPFQVATGVALAHRLANQRHVVVAFCAQERPALETWHDALKFAGVQKLPVLYVIKNGVADQQSKSEHAPHLEAFSFMARDYGYPGIIVDGRDVVAVWRVAHESVHRARNGSGPTLIDCRTESDHDPLAYMEHYMRKRNLWDEGWKKRLEGEIRREVTKAAR
jgi:TPP-dependent pyruvate/acetoin dehydrogenase alpha subunit